MKLTTLLYRTYQLCIAAPLLIILTALTAIVTTIGCTVGRRGHIWGYVPGMIWSRAFCRLMLLPVHVSGHENLDDKQSYVFVANHQGAFDIFLIYGFIGRNFKWMMKQSLRNIPLVGKACEAAGFIFVDKRSRSGIQHTYEAASKVLTRGVSLVVFPEGARSFTGHMGVFRKGAFLLAKEIGLPVVPITIDGTFQVLPRTKGVSFVNHYPLTMTIHHPIETKDRELKDVMDESYKMIMDAQPVELQGYVENKDQ